MYTYIEYVHLYTNKNINEKDHLVVVVGRYLKRKQKWIMRTPSGRLLQSSRRDMTKTLAKSLSGSRGLSTSQKFCWDILSGDFFRMVVENWDSRVLACLFSCRLMTNLLVLCSTSNAHVSILESLFHTRPVLSGAICIASPYPHPFSRRRSAKALISFRWSR